MGSGSFIPLLAGILVSCLRIHLHNKYLLHLFKGGMGVSFQFHHHLSIGRLLGVGTKKRPPCPQYVIEPAKIMEGLSGTQH